MEKDVWKYAKITQKNNMTENAGIMRSIKSKKSKQTNADVRG